MQTETSKPEATAEKTPDKPSGLKSALEFGPVLAFFVAYLWLKDESFVIGGTEYAGFVIVTAGFIPVFVAAMAAMWKLTGHLSMMQLVTTVMVVVFGGLTVWLNDERFFQMKPTLIYLLLGGALGIGLLRGESWLAKVMEGMMPLKHEGWMLLTKRVMWLFFGLAAANEVVRHTMEMSTWVSFKTFGLPIAVFGFFMTQAKLFERFAIEDKKVEDQ
jgi:intracellular septation protein